MYNSYQPRLPIRLHAMATIMSKPMGQRVSDASPWLPEDMVAEILSWLPVESLLRFKCVCKNWRHLIHQDDFVEKHLRRAALCFYYPHLNFIDQLTAMEWPIPHILNDAELWCIDVQKGLLLEHDTMERLHIRNPATRQTVYLPDLRVGDNSPAWMVAGMFFVAKSINECTVISFSASEESVLLGRFRAVTVGVDATWRPLKNSPPNSIHCISNAGRKPKIYSLSIENIFYVVTLDDADDDKKILWVDAEKESIKTTKIPENLFQDWSYVTPREWNSNLSLVYNKGDQINIWVLMNNDWAKSQTVNAATFTLDHPISVITEEKKIWFSGNNNYKTRWRVPWLCKEQLSLKPTVLQLKGMQSDKVEEAMGRVSDESPWLPEDMAAEILSCLPVESLLRFKCVCKNWRHLIHQDDFVEKHYRRAAMCFYYPHLNCINQLTMFEWPIPHILNDAEFSCIDVQKGLLLEHEHCKDRTERLRIRNPATRQTLGRFRALTVGIDATWRPLKNSQPNSIHYISSAGGKSKIYALSIENVFYVVTLDADDKKILWVNAEKESIKTIKIPENLVPDWSYVTPREWNSNLSLFYHKGDQINIWVLMKNSKNDWDKSVNVATFTLDYQISVIIEEKKIWLWGDNYGKRWRVPWVCKEQLSVKPTVLQLKGMQSDKVEEAMGALIWKKRDMQKTTFQIISVISLVPTMSKAMRQKVSDASPSLPEDMVAEILSRLPVESLLRFKCACKNWRQLIQQHDFVEKHHRHAAICFYYINQSNHLPICTKFRIPPIRKDGEFTCIDIQKGLLLEHEYRKDLRERLRIRNPATRQTVYLPDLSAGEESPAWVVARMFFVAKSNNECTVISFSGSEKSVLLGRFRAVTVGVDATWRPLNNSQSNSIHCISNSCWRPNIYALSIENIFYVVTMDAADDKKILWVDAEDESIKTAKIPENLFSDWRFVMPREWNSKLSLCYDNGDDEINIWVLMNNSKNEWAKTQTVDYPIPFIKEEKNICMGVDGKRWWVNVPWLNMKEELSIKPTVLQLKGMQSDKVEEANDLLFRMERDMPKTTSQIISKNCLDVYAFAPS
nr:putative F-box protein At3g52320 [Ipomoea batatas]